MLRFEGAITALVTPFKDGQVDGRALAALVEEQIAAGIDGLVPMGTTGESATASHAEHLAVVEQVVKLARGRVPVVAGAGANATAKAIDLARDVQRAGVDGMLVVTPYYNKPTQDGLFRHFQAIAQACPLPMVVYNVPGRTGCDLLPDTVARLAELPTVIAVKEATGNVLRATHIRLRAPRLTILSGDDFTMFPLFCVGARGVISVLSNIAPAWVAGLWDAFAAGDLARARELHEKIQPLTELLFAESSPIPIKAALALAGKISDELRPPLYPASAGLRERLAAELKRGGLA